MKCKTCNARAIIIFAEENNEVIAKYVCFCGKKKVVEKIEKIKTNTDLNHYKSSLDSLKKRQTKLKEELKKNLESIKKKPELAKTIEKTWESLTVVSTQIAEIHKLNEKYQEESLKFPYE